MRSCLNVNDVCLACGEGADADEKIVGTDFWD
jgi:hypothetical protein